MKEIWSDINGYNGDYQVSNKGRVKSLKRKDARIMMYRVTLAGQKIFMLCRNGIYKRFKLSELMGEAFNNKIK